MTQVAKFKDNAGLNTGSYNKYYQQIATLGHHVDILSIPITFTGFFMFTLYLTGFFLLAQAQLKS